MIVDTSETSLGNFGIYLPNLKQLKLNGSFVPRIRDLGTSLVHLKVIWLSRSGLSELDGLPTLQNLEEVYLAYNEITDISPCSLLDNLKCLDLEGNLIDDLKQVEFLNLCSKLENLTLYGNPICVKPNTDVSSTQESYSYRHEIIKLLPCLKTLDDELTLNTKPLSASAINNSKPLFSNSIKNTHMKQTTNPINYDCPFDDDWNLINQFIEEGIGPSEDKLAINESLRPGTSSSRGSRPNTSVRPLSAMRPLSSYRIKTSAIVSQQQQQQTSLTSSNKSSRVNTSERPTSSSSNTNKSNDNFNDIISDSSNLTVGPTFQGNPLKALMARKKSSNQILEDSNNTDNNDTTKITLNETIKRLETVSISNNNNNNNSSNLEINNQELKNDLIKWRKEHAKKLEERKDYFEPQILKLDDDDYDTNNNEFHALSDNEEMNAYNYSCDEYHEVKNSNDFNETNEYNTMISPRLSSAASSSTYSNNKATNNELLIMPPIISKTTTTRTKSKTRSKSKSNSNNNNEILRLDHDNISDISSRIETGDTGYASFSSISVSSLSSITDRLAQHHHQPIIVSSSSHLGNSLIKSQFLHNNNSLNNNKMVASNSNISSSNANNASLKSLKTNLMPLSASYLQKK
jgi:hypothetical protein